MSVVNELYYREVLLRSGVALKDAHEEGIRRLDRKIEILKAYPGIRFMEFGTRRRFSREWQKYVVGRLKAEVPNQLIGTSNVHLAKELDLPPKGTFAHEMDMIFSGIFHDDIRGSHQKMLEYWWQEYGEELSIALTDTYGTDFFFEDFKPEQARDWRGLRQDSGDPIEFGEKTISFYEKLGIDPHTKTIVFSDGLDIETIVKLHERFGKRIKVVFGWGTDLTNDLGFKALSLVVKATEANGYRTVKLSDNPAKAMGDPADIKKFMEIFGYQNNKKYIECKY